MRSSNGQIAGDASKTRQAQNQSVGGNALLAFSIPKAIERQSMNFEHAAREQAYNSELPDFMREAYMFGLTETSKRE